MQLIYNSGDPDGAKGRFNRAHRRTRCVVERSFGVLKKRFYALGTLLRVKDMLLASKLIECGCILHNLAILYGFSGDDLDQEDQQPPVGEDGDGDGGQGEPGHLQQDSLRERRRNQLLSFFQN